MVTPGSASCCDPGAAPTGGTHLEGTGAASDDVLDELVVGYDPMQARFLLNRGGALGWRSADRPETLQTTAMGPGFRYQLANGAIVATSSSGHLIYASPKGDLTQIGFGTAAISCPKVAPPPGMPPPPPGMPSMQPAPGLTATLGPDGDIVALVCGDTLSIHQLKADGLKSVHSQKLAAPYPAGAVILHAGDARCGALVTLLPSLWAMTPAFPPALIKLDGTQTRLQFPAVPPGPPQGGFPRPPGPPLGLWNSSFTGDGMLLVPGEHEITVFSCDSGAVVDSIALPRVGSQTSPVPLVQRLDRIDRSTFALIDPAGESALLLHWPAKELRPLTVPEQARQTQKRFGLGLVAPGATGGTPRTMEYVRRVTAAPVDSPRATADTFTLPFMSTIPTVLSGGNYLLAESPLGAIVVRLAGPTFESLPDGIRLVPIPIAAKDGWAALRIKPGSANPADFRVLAIERFEGARIASSMEPPGATAAEQAAMRDFFRKFITEVWSKQPPDLQRSAPGEEQLFERKDFQKLVDDPTRLRIRYRPSGRAEPLMAGGATGSHLLCPFVTAIDDAGTERMPAFVPGLMDLAVSSLLVTYTEGGPVQPHAPLAYGRREYRRDVP